MKYDEAIRIVTARIEPVSHERVTLSESAGRILAEDITAGFNVPPFDRSPYDGYAFRAEDSVNPPVILRVIDEVRAGCVSHIPVHKGEAVKVLTGAMIPEGADAVVKYEDTDFTDSQVILHRSFKHGENVIISGEDVRAGEIIAHRGNVIDAGTSGVMASQNIMFPKVFRRPIIGILSTGSELQDIGTVLDAGKIYNSSRYTFEAALRLEGMRPIFSGISGDCEGDIAAIMSKALDACDALVVTGGVSVGDYDRTPATLELLGAEIIVRDVEIKPGGKCIYAICRGKMICCLSGNPASALTNYYVIARPALRKLSGRDDYMPSEIDIVLGNSFGKKSPQTRIIRGTFTVSDGNIVMHVPSEQGNGVLRTMSDINMIAVIPAGSGKLPEGTRLKGVML